MGMEVYYDMFLTVILVIMAVLLILLLVKAILGPGLGDRIVIINMTGTLTVMIISVLSVKMKETFLGDVPLVYAMISFLAVVVLSKIYIGENRKDKN